MLRENGQQRMQYLEKACQYIDVKWLWNPLELLLIQRVIMQFCFGKQSDESYFSTRGQQSFILKKNTSHIQ